jgi:hypothetical protein
MIDRPNASQLLQAMAETLSEHVVPSAQGSAKHAARVVANLCRVLERELALGPETTEAAQQDLAELMSRDGTLGELLADLDERLRTEQALQPSKAGDSQKTPDGITPFESRAHEILLADVRRRLAINKPGYDA